jgi:hypothetical protein
MATIQIPIEILADGTFKTLLEKAQIGMEPLLEKDVPIADTDITENTEVLEILREYLQPMTVAPEEIQEKRAKSLNTSFKKYHHSQSAKYYQRSNKRNPNNYSVSDKRNPNNYPVSDKRNPNNYPVSDKRNPNKYTAKIYPQK